MRGAVGLVVLALAAGGCAGPRSSAPAANAPATTLEAATAAARAIASC